MVGSAMANACDDDPADGGAAGTSVAAVDPCEDGAVNGLPEDGVAGAGGVGVGGTAGRVNGTDTVPPVSP